MTMKPLTSKEMVFLHGIRSLAIMWIVLGHTYVLNYWRIPLMNSNEMLDGLKDFPMMIVLAGFLGVEIFFMLSALLLTLSVFRELDRT